MAGPAVNYYLGLKVGDENNYEKVVTSSQVSAGPGNGTSSDVELRIQINDGSNNIAITRKDVIEKLQVIMEFINGGGTRPGSGTNLPAL